MNRARNRLETDFPDTRNNADKLRRSNISACLQENSIKPLNEPQKKFLEFVRSTGDGGIPRDNIIGILRDLDLSKDDYWSMFDDGIIELDSRNKTIKLKHGI